MCSVHIHMTCWYVTACICVVVVRVFVGILYWVVCVYFVSWIACACLNKLKRINLLLTPKLFSASFNHKFAWLNLQSINKCHLSDGIRLHECTIFIHVYHRWSFKMTHLYIIIHCVTNVNIHIIIIIIINGIPHESKYHDWCWFFFSFRNLFSRSQFKYCYFFVYKFDDEISKYCKLINICMAVWCGLVQSHYNSFACMCAHTLILHIKPHLHCSCYFENNTMIHTVGHPHTHAQNLFGWNFICLSLCQTTATNALKLHWEIFINDNGNSLCSVHWLAEYINIVFVVCVCMRACACL